MNFFKKMKFVSLLVALVTAFTLLPVALPQQTGVAQASNLTDAIDQLEGVYFWLAKDADGLDALNDAKSACASLDIGDIEDQLWPAGGTIYLPLGSIVPGKFATEEDAKDAISQLLLDIAQTGFSTNQATVYANLVHLYGSEQGTISVLMPGISMEDFIGFFLSAQSDGVEDALNGNNGWKDDLQSGNISTIRNLITTTLSGALQYAVGQPGGQDIGDAFQTNGWTIQDLADAETVVQGMVDTNYAGQIALLKAYVRSRAHFTGTASASGGEESMQVKRGNTLTGQIQVLGENVTSDLAFAGPANVTVTKSGSQVTVAGASVTASPVEITAYYNNPDTDWVYKATVTVTSSGGGGGGGGTTAAVTVQTASGSADSSTTATLNGAVASNTTGSSITDYGFYYSPSPLGTSNSGTKVVAGTASQTAPFDFTASLSDLAPDTTYYFRAYAVASGTTYYGGALNFKTLQPPPVQPPVKAFTDVPDGYWAKDQIQELVQNGIVSGYPDGTFKPDNEITRAEFVRVATLALKIADRNSDKPTFSDVYPADWFYQTVEGAVYAGIAKGYPDGTFLPNAMITREEVCVMLELGLGKADVANNNAQSKTSFTDDASIAAWARGFVVTANQDGLIKGYPDGTFAPQRNTTRAEACVMISKLLALQKES